MKLESELVKKIHKLCAKNDIWNLNIKEHNLSGTPDRLLVTREGRYIWLEVKREDKTGRLSPIQTYRHAEMKGYKMTVYVIDDIEQLKEILSRFVTLK